MLKYGEPNPLNVHNIRNVDVLPPHYEVVKFDLKTDMRYVVNWIYENLEGRFWYGEYFSPDDKTGRIGMCKAVAFERHEEASLFVLMVDSINKPHN